MIYFCYVVFAWNVLILFVMQGEAVKSNNSNMLTGTMAMTIPALIALAWLLWGAR